MKKRINSFVLSANSKSTEFPLNNLPYGVFSINDNSRRCGVAVGDYVLDATTLEKQLLIDLGTPLLQSASWNAVMEAGPPIWHKLRNRLIELLEQGSPHEENVTKALVPLASARLHMPFVVTEFTDFFSGHHHATNVGAMFRGPEYTLPPNWLHIPVAYNGRASSVVVSGTDIRRPWGQLKDPDEDAPRFAPSERFDIELELGAIVGSSSNGPVSVNAADNMIFGYVLLNDWSARDIQSWEARPLGPFQSKATATSISPWIVTKAALEPFRCNTPARENELLPHLRDTSPMLYDIDLSVNMAAKGEGATTIARTNYNEMYYSAAQQLAHHTTSGCPMRVGDLIGTGTISGPEKSNRGSLLELSWGGREHFTLNSGEQRSFIEDHDTMTLMGAAIGDDYKIGFGDCRGKLLPALSDPFETR